MNVNEKYQNIETMMNNTQNQYNAPGLITSTIPSDKNSNPLAISSSASTPSSSDCSRATAKDHWRRAADVLRSNPSLMTREILFLTLKNQPPLHIVEFMVRFVYNFYEC